MSSSKLIEQAKALATSIALIRSVDNSLQERIRQVQERAHDTFVRQEQLQSLSEDVSGSFRDIKQIRESIVEYIGLVEKTNESLKRTIDVTNEQILRDISYKSTELLRHIDNGLNELNVTLNSKVDILGEELHNIDLMPLEERISELDIRLNTINEIANKSTETLRSALKTNRDEIFQKMYDEFNEVSTHLRTVESVIDSRFGEVDRKIDEIKSAIVDTDISSERNVIINRVTADMSRVNGDMTSMRAEVDSFRSDLKNIETEVTGIVSSVGVVRDTIIDLTERIDTLSDAQSTYAKAVDITRMTTSIKAVKSILENEIEQRAEFQAQFEVYVKTTDGIVAQQSSELKAYAKDLFSKIPTPKDPVEWEFELTKTTPPALRFKRTTDKKWQYVTLVPPSAYTYDHRDSVGSGTGPMEVVSIIENHAGAHIQEEGVEVVGNARTLNFTGESVTASADGSNRATITVQGYPLFIQDDTPSTNASKYMWIQTNYQEPGGFTFWFQDGE